MRLALCCFLMLPLSVSALEPAEIFLLVNKNVPASRELAEIYAKKRAVPMANLIVLDLPKTEDISRKDYNEKIVAPVRDALKGKKAKARVLLSFYGVPLRVGSEEPTAEEREQLKLLEPELKATQEEEKKLRERIADLEKKKDAADAAMLRDMKETLRQTQNKITAMQNRQAFLSHRESQASVDSELMLLWWDNYELRRFQMNLMQFQIDAKSRDGKPPMMMTCRLDGPSPEVIQRIIDDSIEVEKTGLKGKVYVDARGIRLDLKSDPSGTGYGGYDESMREMAALLEKEGKLPVVLDNKNELFPVGSCVECALYCGWYSHANFIDCCRFVKGAVAWHLASSEAVSLRRPDVKFWCKNLLEKGAVATVGPVAEPYTVGFPKPAEFFGFLAAGDTLVESYSKTVYFASWMGTLIGDPLYRPFGKNPVIKPEQVQPSPKGARIFKK